MRIDKARVADRGSTIPLILGLFLIGLLVVAGAIAAGDTFVQQRQLQDECDGAAVAAASSADLDSGRHPGGADGDFLALGAVQSAVDLYQERDSARAGVVMIAAVGPDGVTVALQCTVTSKIAFGSLFGHSSGVVYQARSTSRGRLRR